MSGSGVQRTTLTHDRRYQKARRTLQVLCEGGSVRRGGETNCIHRRGCLMKVAPKLD